MDVTYAKQKKNLVFIKKKQKKNQVTTFPEQKLQFIYEWGASVVVVVTFIIYLMFFIGFIRLIGSYMAYVINNCLSS